jgi:hypothetical protein
VSRPHLYRVSVTFNTPPLPLCVRQVRDDVREADKWKASARRWESSIVRKMLRCHVRYVKGRVACCRRKRDFFLHADLENERMAADTDEVIYLMERVYVSALHKCMQAAKRVRNLNLLKYMETIYETEMDSDRMYISTCLALVLRWWRCCFCCCCCYYCCYYCFYCSCLPMLSLR